MSEKTATGEAMSFFHMDGFVPSFRQASRFAGDKGHVGTMLDVVDARLATPPKHLNGYDPSNPTPWDQYFTTMSAEYVGMSKGGIKILLVAHGVGPMATERGVVDAYKWQTSDKTRGREGGRITIDEFHKLESGHYGPVEVVELETYLRRYQYPFLSILSAVEAFVDPVLRARLGPRASEYLTEHARLAIEFYKKHHAYDPSSGPMNPYIIQPGDASCSYVYQEVEEGFAFAHLLSIGAISQVQGNDYGRLPTWSCDIGPHRWGDGTRMFGVREGDAGEIRKGPDARKLLLKHWRELMEPTGLDQAPGGLMVLMQLPDETWFTQVPKKGARADTYEPEFLVKSMQQVGEAVRFYTDSNYPVPIFRYDRKEVEAVLPKSANAYALVGEPDFTNGVGSRETCLVQGYRVEVDPTHRPIKEKVLENDYDRMMQLLNVE